MLHQARPGQNFNPRSHERSDTTTVVSSRPFALFQSTLPREERLSSLACMLIFPIFQSTLPREERQMHALKDLENAIFQSTLPREERLNRPFRSISSCISIHAPTRGATVFPAKLLPSKIFQSTLPREERPACIRCQCSNLSYFNPRSHERSDRSPSMAVVPIFDFNPRSHERSDNIHSAICCLRCISIHAPTRGATCVHLCLYSFQSISIHAPTRGATAILHKKFVYFYTIPTINI